MSKIQRSELWAGFTYIAAIFLALGAVSHLAGCSSNIPIGEPPGCIDLVTDECVPEVIEEFCEDCDLDGAYNDGFRDGFDAASKACEEYLDEHPREGCKKPHKRTRGKGHEHHDGDRINLDSDDPLAGVPLSSNQVCITECYPHPFLPPYCVTVCRERRV